MFKNTAKLLTIIGAIYASCLLGILHAEDSNEKSALKNVMPDAAITTSIKGKLLADSEIKSLNIHVETINGKVTLTGKIPNKEIKERVASIANNTEGVKAVIVQLDEVDSSKSIKEEITDASITAAIKAKFLAEPSIKSLNIQVETINGRVTLTGEVPNKEGKDKAEAIASNTNGVNAVISKIEIRL